MRALNNIYQGVQRRGFAKITKLTNIKQVVGFDSKDQLVRHQNVDVYIKSGKIHKIGSNIPEEEIKADKVVDTKGALVTPGFVDPHTHIFPPKDRSDEFCQRIHTTYSDIAAAGGGIKSSVRACRESTFEKIFEVNEKNIQRFIAQGTTTLEMKSGYGLNLDTEIMLLKVINELKKKYAKQIEIVPTFLGAHDVPPEFQGKTSEYVTLIIEKMLPEIKNQGLAEYCDVFCEKGYFDSDESLRLLKAAKKLKYKIRLHADEFQDSKGAKLAARLKAHSADHLMEISDDGIIRLAKKGVVATMLPGTTVYLGKGKFAPVRKMVDSKVRVAIATDYNPGSCVYNSQPLMMNFAMVFGKLTVEEAFMGVTRNAALSLNRKKIGLIEEGAQADLIVWNGIHDIAQIPYYNTESAQYITHTIKKGKIFDRQPKQKKEKKPKAEAENQQKGPQ